MIFLIKPSSSKFTNNLHPNESTGEPTANEVQLMKYNRCSTINEVQ